VVRWTRVSREELEKEFGKDALGGAKRYKGEESEIFYSSKPSTFTRLHEFYHAVESPENKEFQEGKKWQTWDEAVVEELRADEYAAERMGKTLTISMVEAIGTHLIDNGYSPTEAYGSLKRGLDSLGYKPLIRETRSYIWNYLRDYEKNG
jgi:hypothetical protein